MAGLNWVLVNGNLQYSGTLSATVIMAADGTAALPSLTFTSATQTGLFVTTGGTSGVGFTSNGGEVVRIDGFGVGLASGEALWWTSNSGSGVHSAADTIIVRVAPNVLALKNGVASQTLQIYGSTATVDRYLAASCSTGGIASLRPVNITLSTAAGGNKVNIGSSDLTGYLMCGTSTGAPGLIAILGALSTTAEINDPKTSYSVVGGTTNMINVYWDSTAAQYAIENQTGANAVVSAIFLGR